MRTLLLSGGTDATRAVLVTNLQKEDPAWRHIAIEELLALPFFLLIDEDEQAEMAASLACQCIAELQEEKEPMHIVLTFKEGSAILPALRQELPTLKAIHIGKQAEESDFDGTIDTKNRSAGDLFTALKNILKKK